MASRSGPFTTLRSAAVYAANDTWYECDTATITMGRQANCLRIYATVAVASAGNVEFYVQHSPNGGTTYFDLCGAGDAPEVFGPLAFSAAGTKAIELQGINLPPGEVVKVFFRASAGAASATIAIQALAYESAASSVDIATGDVEISLGAVEVDVAAIEVLLADVPNIIGTDGAAGPTKTLSIGGTQATGEIEEVRVDSDGHPQVDVLTLPGGLTGHAEDDAHTTADVGVEMLAVRNDTLASLCDTDGDYAPVQVDADGAVYTVDETAEALLTTIDADTSSIATDAGTIAGDTTSLDAKQPALGTAAMAGSSPVTIASDDTLTTAANALLTTIDADTSSIATDAGTIAGDTTSLDAKQPALGTAAMAGSSPVTIASDDTLTTAANALLTTIDADTSTIAADTTSLDAKQPALGTAAMAASSPVTIASDDTLTTAANALLTTIDADTGIIAGDTTSLDAKVPALGTAAMAASSPVTLASDDTLTTAANALLTTMDADTSSIATDAGTIAGDTTSLDAKQPALGTAAMAASSPVTIATDDTVATDLTAIKTAAEIIDDWDESDRCKSNPIVGQAGVAGGTGVLGATVQRVTVATDDTVATDLTAIKTAAEIIDDWDESDRCKSNPIVGQAGVAAGAGAVGVTVQRTTLASDDPAVTALQIMDDWDDGSDHCEVVDPNRTPLVLNYTGSGAVDVDTSIGAAFELSSISLHLSAAGTTAEDFVVKLDANDGVAYDTEIVSRDLSVGSDTDLVWTVENGDLPRYFESGDEIDIDWPNTETRTYGIRIVYKLV